MDNALTTQNMQQALTDAGIEIYRTGEQELQIAERIRLHLMDSGVRVVLGNNPVVEFIARTQRSDAPSAPANELLQCVRDCISEHATTRGYREQNAQTVQVKDPVDRTRVLDVWYEVTYRKPLGTYDEAVTEVRWALGLDKYVRP